MCIIYLFCVLIKIMSSSNRGDGAGGELILCVILSCSLYLYSQEVLLLYSIQNTKGLISFSLSYFSCKSTFFTSIFNGIFLGNVLYSLWDDTMARLVKTDTSHICSRLRINWWMRRKKLAEKRNQIQPRIKHKRVDYIAHLLPKICQKCLFQWNGLYCTCVENVVLCVLLCRLQRTLQYTT